MADVQDVLVIGRVHGARNRMRLRQENEGEDEAERVFLALVGNNILQPSSR